MARSSQLRAQHWHEYHPEVGKLSSVRGKERAVKSDIDVKVDMRVPDSFESPESSTISRACYEHGTLSVYFKRKHSEDRYDYGQVPPELWAEFVLAESKGQFFSARIRPLYKGTLIVKK